jgi:hypothetical protein
MRVIVCSTAARLANIAQLERTLFSPEEIKEACDKVALTPAVSHDCLRARLLCRVYQAKAAFALPQSWAASPILLDGYFQEFLRRAVGSCGDEVAHEPTASAMSCASWLMETSSPKANV